MFTNDDPKATGLSFLKATLATALAKGTPSYERSIRRAPSDLEGSTYMELLEIGVFANI